jgi:porphobilinogen synthase
MGTQTIRPERLRRTAAIRSLVAEPSPQAEQLVWPVFLNDSTTGQRPVASMPGVFQWSLEASYRAVDEALKAGVSNVILFGVPPPSKKDAVGSEGWNAQGIIPRAVFEYKKRFGAALTVWADTCFCEYTDHGHCGVFGSKNDEWVRQQAKTLENLQKAALVYAQAGTDVIAPSGMIDGMIRSLRQSLDQNGFEDRILCSYAVKYASAFYGPFRDAAENAPSAGTDRKAYQMDPRNRREAWREASLDCEQGADLIMVKPGLPYLDVLADVAARCPVPVGAYQVSGEYSMVEAAAAQGWVDRRSVILETLTSLRRAGAQFILTYWAKEAAEWLKT